MGRFEILAGDFGTGSASYDAGAFKLPGGKLQNVANVTTIEANTTVVEKHWGRAVASGVRNAAGLAPVAMIVGIFAAPLIAVGTIGIAAAAIGGAIGLLGGGAKDKALIQITFQQGTGLVGVCDITLVETIRNDRVLIRAQAERERGLLQPPLARWPFRKARETLPEDRPKLEAPILAPPAEQAPVPSRTPVAGAGDIVGAASAAAASAVETTGQAVTGFIRMARRATQRDKK